MCIFSRTLTVRRCTFTPIGLSLNWYCLILFRIVSSTITIGATSYSLWSWTTCLTPTSKFERLRSKLDRMRNRRIRGSTRCSLLRSSTPASASTKRGNSTCSRRSLSWGLSRILNSVRTKASALACRAAPWSPRSLADHWSWWRATRMISLCLRWRCPYIMSPSTTRVIRDNKSTQAATITIWCFSISRGWYIRMWSLTFRRGSVPMPTTSRIYANNPRISRKT